jgi:hypothetical protein
MKNITLIFLVIILFFSCTKDNLSHSASLIGKWSWVFSCPGFSHSGCWSPDSDHKAYFISIESDSTYNVFHNDTLTSSRKFQTAIISDIYGNIITHIIKFKSGVYDMYTVSYDTLRIVNMEGMEIISDSYKRIK